MHVTNPARQSSFRNISLQSNTTMKTYHHITLAVIISLFLTGLPAMANLIQATDPSFGPNSLTIDTSTGLGWLDLTASAGLSYQQVLADTQPGGIYSGFRFATAQEVLTLYTSAGIPGTGEYPASTPSILSLISLVGATSFQDGNPQTFGISGTSDSGLQVVPGLDFLYVNGVPMYDVTGVPGQGLDYGLGYGNPAVGSWLVTNVPETADASIYLLAAAGLFGFMLLPRHRKAANNSPKPRPMTLPLRHATA